MTDPEENGNTSLSAVHLRVCHFNVSVCSFSTYFYFFPGEYPQTSQRFGRKFVTPTHEHSPTGKS